MSVYEDRRKQGLCVQCGDPANGKSKCTPCAEKDKACRAKRTEKRKTAGLCVNCKNPAMPGCATCQACSQKSGVLAVKRYYEHKAAGVCRQCGDPTENDASRCSKCAPKVRVLHNAWLDKKRQNNVCLFCQEPARSNRKTCLGCSKNVAARQKAATAALKLEVLNKYSNNQLKCAKCGYDKDIRGLQVDHINGGGGKHRKEIGRSQLYPWLKKNGFPAGYQVLCATCNFVKGKESPDEQTTGPDRPLSKKEESHEFPRTSPGSASDAGVQPGVL